MRFSLFAVAVLALAANAAAAPTLKALWLRNDHNTNSVKPAIDRLAKRLGTKIAFESRDVTALEKAATIPEKDLKALHDIAPDFVVMTFGENVKCASPYGAMSKWIQFFRSFRALPSRPAMVFCAPTDEKGRKEVNGWISLASAASRGSTDFILAGLYDDDALQAQIAELLHESTFPRIVPIAPKLSEIDPATGEIEFLYPGKFPNGRANYRLQAGIDGAWRASAPVGEDGRVKMRLGGMTEGAHALHVRLTDLTAKHPHMAVSQAVYQMRARRIVTFDSGKRLNNLVTELRSDPLADGKAEFVNPRDGYVAIAVEGAGRVEARLDGADENIMPVRRDEPAVAMRWLTAGRHSVVFSGAEGTGRVVLRAVKTIRMLEVGWGWSEMRRRFSEAYVNMGSPWHGNSLSQMFAEGNPTNNIGRPHRRGCRLIPEFNIAPTDYAVRGTVDGVVAKIRNSCAWSMGMGVTIDENRVGEEMGYTFHYTLAEAIWRISTPSQPIGVYWAGNSGTKFGDPARLASELAAIANSGEGRGLNLFETYQRSVRDVKDVERQFDATIASMQSMADMVPATKGTALCYFGTYYFPGAYTPLVSPYADHRVLLDLWVRRLATDRTVEDLLAGIASGNYSGTDEEMTRWISALMRHYAIDGATELLSDRYGYRYNPGFLANPDFDEDLKGWTAEAAAMDAGKGASSPTVSALRIPGYGASRQGRKRKGAEGDRMALFVRRAAKANRLSQKVSGLVPGRHYALVFYSSDYDEHLGMKEKKSNVPQGRRRLRVDFAGGENVPALELHRFGSGGVKPGKFSICRNRYVFRADAPEVTLTILDRNAGEGESVPDEIGLRQIVNFVEMHEYYTGGLSVEEIAEVTGGRR